MTARELYLSARASFSAAGIEDPGFEASLLCGRFLGLDRTGLALHGEESPEASRERDFLEAVSQRVARRPLQYILGEWEFMGLTLQVGEGVLIPREDTAVLVEAVARRLGPGPVVGLDLCAGTGAVALGLCSLLPEAHITAIELDAAAFRFLRKNTARYPQYLVELRQADILSPDAAQPFADLDLIASNPPYIASAELPGLQPEVRREPSLALDGGGDGLAFYRAIASIWAQKLRPGGVLGVEIGESQAEAVAGIFQAAGLGHIQVHQDWGGLDRAVTAVSLTKTAII